jgi:predicted dehydrogenase
MMVKELIDDGYIGQLHMALVSLIAGLPGRFQPRPYSPDRDVAENGGGMLFGLGSHYIDCLRHWFGEIEAAEGQLFTHFADRIDPSTQNIVQATGDDTFHFTLHFARRGWASMNATMAAPFGSGGRTEIYGREGTLVTPHKGLGMNPPAHGTVLAAKPGDEGLKELPIPERLQPFADERDDRLMPFRLFAREFVRGIEEGTSPAPNFYDGFRCQQVLDAIRESSASGRLVRIALE